MAGAYLKGCTTFNRLKRAHERTDAAWPGEAMLNGRAFGPMDEVADDEKVKLGTTEVWEFANDASVGMRMAHPMHAQPPVPGHRAQWARPRAERRFHR